MDTTTFTAIIGTIIASVATLIGAAAGFIERRNKSRFEAYQSIFDEKLAAQDMVLDGYKDANKFLKQQVSDMQERLDSERELRHSEQATLRSYYEDRLTDLSAKLREEHAVELAKIVAAHSLELQGYQSCIDKLQSRVAGLESN